VKAAAVMSSFSLYSFGDFDEYGLLSFLLKNLKIFAG
jgi:hypothetical protein